VSAALPAARPRWRSALLAGALLVGSAPFVAQALAPALSCAGNQTGRWERIPVKAFAPLSGLPASQNDAVTAYSVSRSAAENVAATNGSTVLLSRSHGCGWATAFNLSATPTASQAFAGVNTSLVGVGLLGNRVLIAAREGSGAASRPHVLVSTNGDAGSFASGDSGLPAQGAPGLLRTGSDGRTAYLTISPTASGGGGGGATGIVPGLPGTGGVTPGATPTGLLYKTSDGGASWTLQTSAADLPGGGTGLDALDIDAGNSNVLYGLVNGQVVISRDGGASFATPVTGTYTAITAMGPNAVAAFSSSGKAVISSDAGNRFASFDAPAGVTSAASRAGDSSLVVESGGTLRQLTPGFAAVPIPAAGPATRGSLLGDRGAQASFHALSGHSLLRFVDPLPRGTAIPPAAVGDLSVPPPVAGTISPGTRNVSLPIGSSEREDFTLNLPKNPTPLDLFFLVDVSSSMDEYINDVKANIGRIVGSLTAAKVDLKVGIGTIGTGAAKGEAEYPDAYLYPPICGTSGCTADPRNPYVKPSLYRRIRAIGDTGPKLTQAVDQLKLETVPNNYGANPPQNHEGQLIALKNLAEGKGTPTQADTRAGLGTLNAVPPGQDAGFRGNPNVRRLVIMATNEKFDNPYGTDANTPGLGIDANLNFAPTLRALTANRIQVVGLTVGANLAEPDLETISRGTHALAPAGGVDCGGNPDVQLNPGQPLVCGNADQFSGAIIRILASFVDRQNVQVVATNHTPVLGSLNGGRLRGLDVKKPNAVGFSVNVSCVDVKPGTYHQDVNAVLRQTVVGAARLNVTCVQAAAAVPPKPLPAAAAPNNNPPPPAAQPVGNVVPPIAPPAPAAQPQVNPQVQTQVQIQPLTAAAMEEQQELQLALAMNSNASGTDDEPAFSAGQQMAMVDRRKREQVQALGVLAFAITASAGLGLARLRSRPEPSVRRAR
jgi:hypothetical protein